MQCTFVEARNNFEAAPKAFSVLLAITDAHVVYQV